VAASWERECWDFSRTTRSRYKTASGWLEDTACHDWTCGTGGTPPCWTAGTESGTSCTDSRRPAYLKHVPWHRIVLTVENSVWLLNIWKKNNLLSIFVKNS